MWKAFFESGSRFEFLRIGGVVFISTFFWVLQYFHVLPDAFFTSKVYGLIQIFLGVVLSLVVIYTIYIYQHRKNLERLKKDMDEIRQETSKEV